MLVCWIIANFFAALFSCRCMFTFSAFSDGLSPRGIRDEKATSIPLVFILFANCIISLAISDRVLLFLSRLSLYESKVSCHGWFDVISHVLCFRAMDGLMQSPMSFVVAQENDVIILKHSLSELFKLQLRIFPIIQSPTIATVFFFSFPVDFTPSM